MERLNAAKPSPDLDLDPNFRKMSHWGRTSLLEIFTVSPRIERSWAEGARSATAVTVIAKRGNRWSLFHGGGSPPTKVVTQHSGPAVR